jgi:hypothetical protein
VIQAFTSDGYPFQSSVVISGLSAWWNPKDVAGITHILLRGMWASSTVQADLHGPSGYAAPPRVVLVDAPPVVIGHIDNFGQRRRGHEHDRHHSR